MAKQDYPSSWEKKYTDPELRAELKDTVTAGDKGGKSGQWSARKAQLLATEYEKAGGGYLGGKDADQQHLSQWTEEDWQTSDGSDRARTGAADERGGAVKRYLPKQAWEQLSDQEKRDTDAAKAEGSRQGRQFVANTSAAAEAGRRARTAGGDAGLPIPGYDELTAREAAKAVGALTQVAELRAIRDHERRNAGRKTVLDRVDKALDRLG